MTVHILLSRHFTPILLAKLSRKFIISSAAIFHTVNPATKQGKQQKKNYKRKIFAT